jgi:hypothetical protein
MGIAGNRHTTSKRCCRSVCCSAIAKVPIASFGRGADAAVQGGRYGVEWGSCRSAVEPRPSAKGLVGRRCSVNVRADVLILQCFHYFGADWASSH